MADAAELKHMVMSFRVSELQVLLGFAGRNKSGRKQDLLMRALQLIAKGCSTPVQIKIRELYRSMVKNWGSNAPEPPAPATRKSERCRPGANKVPYPTAQSRSPSTDSDDRRRFPNRVSGPSSGLGSGSGDPSRHASHLDYGKHSSHTTTSGSGGGFPVHPDVRFKRLPFYDILGELLKPSTLVPRNSSRFQETFFVFHLTPQQAQDIAMSRDMRPGSKCDYQVQVQLRFCCIQESCPQTDDFPPSIMAKINSKIATLPNPIPTNKPGVEPKRPGRPVNITSLCRISPTIPNHVNISWASEFARGYCVGVYLVRKQTSDVLLQRLKASGIKHPDHSRALIKEKLHHDPDSEIATTSLRVSLLCPLGKMRIQIACRANTCTHLQCFDAITYLMMNEKKPTWNCPVCDKSAPFDNLIIDGLFQEIFQKCTDTNEIQFVEDGSWSPLKHVKTEVILSSPCTKPPTAASVSSSSSSSSSSSAASSPGKKPKPDVVDLTLSSSDEDDDSPPPPKKMPSGPSVITGSHSAPSLQSAAATAPPSCSYASSGSRSAAPPVSSNSRPAYPAPPTLLPQAPPGTMRDSLPYFDVSNVDLFSLLQSDLNNRDMPGNGMSYAPPSRNEFDNRMGSSAGASSGSHRPAGSTNRNSPPDVIPID